MRHPHDRDRLRRPVDPIIRSHDRLWLRRERCALPADDQPLQPLFIIGMLRSGTTLAEQILASHPQVTGVGELTFWSAQIAARTTAATPSLQPHDAELERLRLRYLDLLRAAAPGPIRIVNNIRPTFSRLD